MILSIDQKIELMKLASVVGASMGATHNSVDATLKNYNQIVSVIDPSTQLKTNDKESSQ